MSRSKRMDEFLVGERSFCCEQDPRGFFVQAVDDPRSQGVLVRGQAAAMGQECVDEGAAWVARSRMNDHSHRFIDSDEMLVFIKNIEWDWFGGKRAFGGELETDFELVAGL